MHMKRFPLLVLLWGCISPGLHAERVTEYYPTITNTSITYVDRLHAKFTITSRLLSFEYDDTSSGPIELSRLPKAGMKNWGVGMRYKARQNADTFFSYVASIPIPTSNTDSVAKLGAKAFRELGSTVSDVQHQYLLGNIQAEGVICALWAGAPEPYSAGYIFDHQIDPFLYGSTATCQKVSPPPKFCDVITPTLLLDHGTVTLDIGIHEANDVVSVRCAGAARVTLSLDKTILHMGDGIESELSFPEGNVRNMTSAGGDIPIKSTLKISSLGQSSGVLESSAVLTLDWD